MATESPITNPEPPGSGTVRSTITHCSQYGRLRQQQAYSLMAVRIASIFK
jgi:hypothetical protein